MKNTWSYSQLLLLLLVFFSAGTAVVYGQNQSQLPDLRDCGFSCTSQNVRVPQAFLSDIHGNRLNPTQISCSSTSSEPVYIAVELWNNSNSVIHNTRVIADLEIGGAQGSIVRVNYFIGRLEGSERRVFVLQGNPIQWDCRSSIRLLRPGVFWTTNGNNDFQSSYACNSYSNSQCERPSDIVVQLPFIAQFSSTACAVNEGFVANFSSAVGGGVPPYRYAWNFGPNASQPSSTSPNPQGITFSQPSLVTLTVTDTLNAVRTFQLTVSAVPILIQSDLIPLTSEKSSDGSIELTVSGGVAPFSYQWVGPDGFVSNSKDIFNLRQGTYAVTVTDANGCIKTSVFEMGLGIGLPVTWLGFTGRWLDQQSKVRLDWSTAAEYGASFFEVERSANNGEDFRAITLIPAVGNSQTPSYYSFEDENMDPRVQRYYYRVKQTSGDGSFSYTRVLLMQRTQIQTIPLETWAAFPNPSSNNRLTLQLEGAGMSALDKKYQVTMYSALGHYKTEFKTLGNKIELDDFMGAVPKGLLIVEIRDEEGKMQILKVMKQ